MPSLLYARTDDNEGPSGGYSPAGILDKPFLNCELTIMAGLPAVTSRRIVAALRRLGFYEVRQKGSHLQLKRGNLLVTVPMHAGDMSRGVLHSILRQGRIPLEELKEAL